jgi:hypothetical protein
VGDIVQDRSVTEHECHELWMRVRDLAGKVVVLLRLLYHISMTFMHGTS